MILVPVKNLAEAKQRLAAALEPSTRTELAQAMLADVLDTLAEYDRAEVRVVTSDAYAVELAEARGFKVIPDGWNRGETQAIQMATELCVAQGATGTLVIPGDVPLVSAADLRTIYQNAPETGSVVVPSRDKRGTNAILRRPPALFALRFGSDSFMPHLAEAISTNTSCVVLSLPRLALDIDTPADLEELARAPGDKRSQRLARKLGFSGAPGASAYLNFEEGQKRPETAKL
jgi:2-phospho-L-lactate/phosphoenolpyruvate guanylyltransferase